MIFSTHDQVALVVNSKMASKLKDYSTLFIVFWIAQSHYIAIVCIQPNIERADESPEGAGVVVVVVVVVVISGFWQYCSGQVMGVF